MGIGEGGGSRGVGWGVGGYSGVVFDRCRDQGAVAVAVSQVREQEGRVVSMTMSG